LDDWDFARDGLHINRRGARHLGHLYWTVCAIGDGRQEDEERMAMHGGRDLQQGDIWGDSDDINTGTRDGLCKRYLEEYGINC
jgi:hypothetical protein